MRYLENRTYDSKREMDILDAIDETEHLNKRRNRITPDELLKMVIGEEVGEEIGFERLFKSKMVKLEDDDQDSFEDRISS